MAVQDPTDNKGDIAEEAQSEVRAPKFGVVGRIFVHTFESIIANRDFRMLWFGMVLSMGGFQMQMVARGILAYEMTDDALITGLIGLGFAPSLLVVSIWGGVLGDRMERRTLIQASQAANGLLAGLVGVLLFTDSLAWGHLLGVSVAQGAMFALQMPARQAAIPSLVGKNQLPNAFALNAMAMSMMTLIAPALAGVLYEVIGPKNVYVIVCAVMLIAVIFTSLVPKMPPPSVVAQSVLENILEGFRYIGQNKLILNIMIYSVIVALLSMPFRMLVQVYAKDVYGSEPSEVGMLLTALGLGGLVGTVSIANLREGHYRGWIVLIGALIASASLGLIVAVPVYFAGVLGMVGMGLAEQARWALGQSLMMENTSDQYRARVMSVLMMTFGLMPIGMVPLGYAMKEYGARPPVAWTSIALLTVAVLSIFLMPQLRRIK
ncbi:MAG: MFS transporter [Dehalococcoidia bacterium]|nr:MFS transporter [Dehalococcoidia bacterium]MDP7262546.1 MFS transporter [Dehalococcoidia bacterium]MDP7484997.1 MFS transporter [Dehalococcoidia bacterium]